MKYDVTVTGIGDMAFAFLDPEMEMRFVVLFDDNAPAELAELALLHTKGALTEAPAPGDTMKIGEKTYKVTAVGDEAIHTLATLDTALLRLLQIQNLIVRAASIWTARLSPRQMLLRELSFRSSDYLLKTL